MKIVTTLILASLTFLVFGQQDKNSMMQQILKNRNLEIIIDFPSENYDFSRFDWTGKITSVKYKGIYVSGVENTNVKDENNYGKGFYNEFGIDAPIGFNEIKEGEWFHKIGIGILKKEGEQYDFSKAYDIQPAEFNVKSESNKVIIESTSQSINGYSYFLKKEIELLECGFVIKYYLHNTGDKTISTNEYNHNFLAINKEFIGKNYILKFPFQLKTGLFDAVVNPEGIVETGHSEFTFNNTPKEQFFFSNLSGNQSVIANWELINTKSKIGISETASFNTSKINLWGWTHVICPELFFDIRLEPDQLIEWSRTYKIFDI